MIDQVDDAGADAVRLKANFTDIYDRPDPRAYFRALGDLGYTEPAHMRRVAEALVSHLVPRGDRASVLDVCCSYGMLGMLLSSDLSFDDLATRYRDPAITHWSTQQLVDDDSKYLARHRLARPPTVHGLDVAEAAVDYARAVGAVAQGFAEDLEAHAPSPSLRRVLATVDLVTVAGGVGYVTERTLDRLMRASGPGAPPWVAALVSRVYPYDRIASTLAGWGLVTERLSTRTFARRRFTDDAEQQAALAQLRRLDVDPTGRESDGWYHTDLYVSRPVADAGAPTDTLLADL